MVGGAYLMGILGSFRMFAIVSLLALVLPVLADDPPKPDSPLVKALKAGKVPEERQGPVVAAIVKRGSPSELGYILGRVVEPSGFTPAVRREALDALADAAQTGKEKPDFDLSRLEALIRPDNAKADAPSRLAALKLAGFWKVEALTQAIAQVAADPATDTQVRASAFDALAAIGNSASRKAIESLASGKSPKPIRAAAIAALAKFDAGTAASLAADLIAKADRGQDLAPLVAAFLNRQGGAEILAEAVAGTPPPPDNAKLALRAVYAIGHADPAIVTALSKAAGIESDTRPPSPEELDRMVADVIARGDSARGERVFRREDLNCSNCHAIEGAGGGVGPDLSAVGLSSPVDYVIRSILLPDESIKEQYHTLVVATVDGQVFQGIVADKDESKVVLREATGDLRTVPSSEIEESREGGSLMPKGLANLLTRDEFLDLVRFVAELGKPGPYAIHAVPTIQRWRVMTPVPEALARSVPDSGAFVARVRDSDPSLWQPAYALATGALPLDEFAAEAGGPVLYLRGQIDVSVAGPVTFLLDKAGTARAWIDGEAAPEGEMFTRPLEPGRHTLTLRVDTTESAAAIRKVEVAKPPDSDAEFVVVGGR